MVSLGHITLHQSRLGHDFETSIPEPGSLISDSEFATSPFTNHDSMDIATVGDEYILYTTKPSTM